MENKQNAVLYGYMEKDGKIVSHPLQSEVLKWYAEKLVEYPQNPPAELIRNFTEEHYVATKEWLTAEQAAQIVTPTYCATYLEMEFKLKRDLYNATAKEFTPEELKAILALGLDEATKAYAQVLMNPQPDSYSAPIGGVFPPAVPVEHQPIICQELYDAVQQELAETPGEQDDGIGSMKME